MIIKESTKNLGQNEDDMIISIIRQAKNDYYEASESVLQIGHLLGSN